MPRFIVPALTALALPAIARACPACASNPVDSRAVLAIVGWFLLVPFAVAIAVIAVVTRIARRESAALADRS